VIRPWLAALAVAAACLMAGCRDQSPDRFATAPLTPELRQMLNEIAVVRGLDPPPSLEAGTVSRLDVPDLLEHQLTPTDRAWFATTTTLYRLLGHLGPGQDLLSAWKDFAAGSVVGLYSPVQDRLWVVQREPAVNLDAMSPSERSTLAHELIHAVQDYHFALDQLAERTALDLDWGLAASAVIEGDAVTHQGLWDGQRVTVAGGARLFFAPGPLANGITPSLEREFRFPYTTGAEWVNILRSEEGTAAIDRYLAGEHISTAHILHPDLRRSGWRPETVALPDITAALGSGWQRESGGTMGEFHLANYLQLRLTALPAYTAAAGWRGDHYDAYVRGDESVAVFRVRFAGETDAGEFAAAQRELLTGGGAAVATTAAGVAGELPDGRTTIQLPQSSPSEVIFVIGSSRDAAEHAAEALVRG